MPLPVRVVALALLAVWSSSAVAAGATIAVAANFTAPAQRLAADFERRTGHKINLSFGSTGKFYSQIVNGAPFDVLLAADAATPQRLAAEGRAVAGSSYPYALGRLVLWSARPGLVDDGGAVLRGDRYARMAIANPKLAPYGAAAQQALERLGLWASVQPKLVTGENIAQTYQFVATGNAELGFVALAQLKGVDAPRGSQWQVPEQLHDPIRQDAVLLARAVIRDYGYGLP